jgi:hypothetical protein
VQVHYGALDLQRLILMTIVFRSQLFTEGGGRTSNCRSNEPHSAHEKRFLNAVGF